MNKVFIDCNILIDWIFDRFPFSIFASKLITEVEKQNISAYVSPIVLANVYYIIRKEKNREIAESFLIDCKNIFNLAGISQDITFKAIVNRNRDFEDDLHYYTALEYEIEYIITRNVKDYKMNKIKICTAEEYLIQHDKI